MKRIAYFLSMIGLVVILAAAAAVVYAMVFASIKNTAAKDSFITAFGGAAFAYLFVKYGEMFTRLSQREKLNIDTVVNLEYLFNKQLNQLGDNMAVSKQMADALKNKRPLHFLEFKPITIGTVRLQDMKNVDFINDVFNYFDNLEKLNADMYTLQKMSEKLIDDMLKAQGRFEAREYVTIQAIYNANSKIIIAQLEEILGFLERADKNVDQLIGKIGYVKKHRAWWLSLAVPGFNATHYNEKRLKKELPGYMAQFKKTQQENIDQSLKEIEEVKKKTAKSSGKSTD